MKSHRSLLKAIASDLKEISTTSSEVVIDAMLKDGSVLESLPISNLFVGFAKTGLSIRDEIFLNKVLEFLNPLSEISGDKRQRFLNQLVESERERLGQTIILYLERVDSLDKPRMLGNALVAFLEDRISKHSLLHLFRLVDQTSIVAIETFNEAIELRLAEDNRPEEFRFAFGLDPQTATELIKAGFYYRKGKVNKLFPQQGPRGRTWPIIHITRQGWRFVQHVLGYWSDIRWVEDTGNIRSDYLSAILEDDTTWDYMRRKPQGRQGYQGLLPSDYQTD